MANISTDELGQLHALATRAAQATDRPAWARIMNEAAHIATLMAEGPERYDTLDKIRRGVAEVRNELGTPRQAGGPGVSAPRSPEGDAR